MDERVIVSRDPLNAETRLDLQEGVLTPTGRHYVRSHFSFPAPPGAIAVGGAVRSPRSIGLDALRSLPARSAMVTLECAGNGRAFLDPPAPGEQWKLGAVSTAAWTGVTLRTLLEPAGLFDRVIEVLFRGADGGEPAGLGRRITFERSLPLERALADDVLVAYAMNSAPIPTEHGAPVRLVVPNWYGMASVKWLVEIIAIEEPFRGFYQADRYVSGDQPLRTIRPRAVITAPLDAVRAGSPWPSTATPGRGRHRSPVSISRSTVARPGARRSLQPRLRPPPGANGPCVGPRRPGPTPSWRARPTDRATCSPPGSGATRWATRTTRLSRCGSTRADVGAARASGPRRGSH